MTVRPTFSRSSAVTNCIRTHCSLCAPAGVSQRTCQSPWVERMGGSPCVERGDRNHGFRYVGRPKPASGGGGSGAVAAEYPASSARVADCWRRWRLSAADRRNPWRKGRLPADREREDGGDDRQGWVPGHCVAVGVRLRRRTCQTADQPLFILPLKARIPQIAEPRTRILLQSPVRAETGGSTEGQTAHGAADPGKSKARRDLPHSSAPFARCRPKTACGFSLARFQSMRNR